MFGGTDQQTTTARPSKNNQAAHECYCCWGWGYMAKEYAMPLNYSKGTVSMFPLLKVKEIKKSSNKPHHPQSSKRMLL